MRLQIFDLVLVYVWTESSLPQGSVLGPTVYIALIKVILEICLSYNDDSISKLS